MSEARFDDLGALVASDIDWRSGSSSPKSTTGQITHLSGYATEPEALDAPRAGAHPDHGPE